MKQNEEKKRKRIMARKQQNDMVWHFDTSIFQYVFVRGEQITMSYFYISKNKQKSFEK